MLQVLLLGSPEIRFNGELIPIKRKLARHLLVYLACAPGKIGRAELTSLFWSEETDTVANARLRDTLRHLKEQLPEKDLIIKYLSQLAIDNVKVYVDVKDFDHKLISIRRSLQFWSHNNPVPAGTLVVMQEALHLWRTPYFLHGINLPEEGDYANWVIRTGQRLEMDRQYLLTQLVDHALVNGSSIQALDWLQQALQTDELHPDLNLRYIETLMELDRLPEALSQIRYLRKQYLLQDYGEFPPALERVYQKLRHPAARQVEGESNLADSLILETPYVGQPTLLEEMNRLFALRNGAIIRGEAGSGKTRLLHELSKSISPLPRFIQINPKAAEKDLAYHAIAVMLSQGITDTEWRALNPSFASELLLLVPELAEKFPNIKPAAEKSLEDARSLLLEAFYQIMVICSHNGKLVIAIDDAHWCDSASLNAIGYLAQRAFFRRNGMLILTTRPDIHSVTLDRFINTYKTSAYLHPIVLPAFGYKEVNELTHFLTGEKPAPELIHQLVKASGGNPLFLIEILRSAMGYLSSETILEKIQKIPITSNMAAIIKERLQNVSQIERNILNIAAIYGESIHPWLLENVSGYSAEEVADALEMLEDEHRLLQLNTQRGDIHYSFVHEKVRETLVQNIYPPRRRLLHLRIAEIIQHSGEKGYAGSLKIAHHFDQAGLPNRAISHYLHAAQFAWQMLSQEDCYTQLEHAERMLNMLGEQAAAQEFHAVYALWEKYAVELDDRSTLERISHTMIQKGERINSPLLVGAGTSGLALCQAYANQIDQALENIGKAITFLERTDSILERMTAYTREAMFFMFTSQYEQAEKAYLQALQTGETAGNPSDSFAINTQTKLELAMLFIVRGKVNQALEMAQAAHSESELSFNQTGKLYANILIALAHYFQGKPARAIQLCQEHLSLAEEMHNGRGLMYLNLIIAHSALHMGAIQLCWTHLQAVKELGNTHPVVEVLTASHTIFGELFLRLGENNEAYKELEEGLVYAGHNYHSQENLFWLGMSQRARGEVEAGNRIIDKVLTEIRSEAMTSLWLKATLNNAIWLVQNDNTDEAIRVVKTIQKMVANSELKTPKILMQYFQSNLEFVCKNPSASKVHAIKTIKLAQESQQRWIEINAWVLLWKQAQEQSEKDRINNNVQELMDTMGMNIQDTWLQDVFQNYRRHIFNDY